MEIIFAQKFNVCVCFDRIMQSDRRQFPSRSNLSNNDTPLFYFVSVSDPHLVVCRPCQSLLPALDNCVPQIQFRCHTEAHIRCPVEAQPCFPDILKFQFWIVNVLERFSKMISKEKKIKGLERRKTLCCLETNVLKKRFDYYNVLLKSFSVMKLLVSSRQ